MTEIRASEPLVLLRAGVSFVALVAGWAAANLLFPGWMALGWTTHGIAREFIALWLLITGAVSVASWLVYGLLGFPLGIYPLIRDHHEIFYVTLFAFAAVTAAVAGWVNAVLLNFIRGRGV